MIDGDITGLIDDLGHSHKAVQRRAADALAAAASDGAIAAALRSALHDPCPARRWGAAYALARFGPPPLAALPTLLDVLGSRDGDLRWAAADIITRLGAAAAPDLLRLATTGDAGQRKMALYCLRDLRVTGVEAERAVQAALSDQVVTVRLAGLAALPQLVGNRQQAAGYALGLVDDPDDGVRRTAVVTLGSLGERSRTIDAVLHRAASNDTDAGLRRAAQRALRMLAGAESPTSKVQS